MVAEAEGRLGSDHRFGFRGADVRELPCESGRFDAVVANYMLYHVPHSPRALWEISGPAVGRIPCAATDGKHTHKKEMGWMQHILDPSHPKEDYPSRLISTLV
jgi:hypothetical protein